MIVVTWGSATDTGRVRARNEDAVLAEAPVFLVADGMGGHLGGEVASQLTVDTFREILGRPTVVASDIPVLLQDANESIRLRASVDPSVSDMGTTAVGLAMVTEDGGDYWLAFNVGDSRIYRLHEGELTQVTVDHSYVQDLVAAGRIAPEDARTHPERNIVTRVLGVQDHPIPDFWVFPPEPGERFLICSDGLSGELDDPTIAALLAVHAPPHEIARQLVEAANSSGGRDNITVIVVDVAGADTGELPVVSDDERRAETTLDLPIVDDAPTQPSPVVHPPRAGQPARPGPSGPAAPSGLSAEVRDDPAPHGQRPQRRSRARHAPGPEDVGASAGGPPDVGEAKGATPPVSGSPGRPLAPPVRPGEPQGPSLPRLYPPDAGPGAPSDPSDTSQSSLARRPKPRGRRAARPREDPEWPEDSST
jgi:protein phosphatase